MTRSPGIDAHWAMTRTDTHWHYWIGDRTVCGLDRDTPWTLGHVQAGDCPACTDRLHTTTTERPLP